MLRIREAEVKHMVESIAEPKKQCPHFRMSSEASSKVPRGMCLQAFTHMCARQAIAAEEKYNAPRHIIHPHCK